VLQPDHLTIAAELERLAGRKGLIMNIYRQPPESGARRLLTESELPTCDVTPEHLSHFFGCGSTQKPQGVVGLEIYGSVALLRSLAVAEKKRGVGCGKALVAEAERYAQTCGVKRLICSLRLPGSFLSAWATSTLLARQRQRLFGAHMNSRLCVRRVQYLWSRTCQLTRR
jgi:amino-acid N-acetyltransferase